MAAEATTSTLTRINLFAGATGRSTNEGSGLADELLINILQYLDLPSLGNVMQTCRRACRVGNDPTVWRRVLIGLGIASRQKLASLTTIALKSIAYNFHLTYDDLQSCLCDVNQDFITDETKPNFTAQPVVRAAHCSEAFDGEHHAYITDATNTLVITNLRTDQVILEHSFDEEEDICGLGFDGNANIAIVGPTILEIRNINDNSQVLRLTPPHNERRHHGYVVEYKNNHVFVGLEEGQIIDINLVDSSYTSFGRTRHGSYVSALCFSENTLFAGHADGEIIVFDTTTYKQRMLPRWHTGYVCSLTQLGRSSLVSAGEDHRPGERNWDHLKLWNLETGLSTRLEVFGPSPWRILGLTSRISSTKISVGISFIIFGSNSFITDITFPAFYYEDSNQEEE